MTDYWKNYWDNYTADLVSSNPLEQVLRVKNKKAQSKESFERSLMHIRKALNIGSDCNILDLCCGNGVISNRIALEVKSVYGVDFCEKLIDTMRKTSPDNVKTLISDVHSLKFNPNSFERVLCAAALQHFTMNEVVRLLEKAYSWVIPSGVVFITDVLDISKQWDFYNTIERESVYFEHLKKEKPILGTWFDPVWLVKLGRYIGFKSVEIIEQPSTLIYSHYRFDVRFIK